jgi:hypothetical protein
LPLFVGGRRVSRLPLNVRARPILDGADATTKEV